MKLNEILSWNLELSCKLSSYAFLPKVKLDFEKDLFHSMWLNLLNKLRPVLPVPGLFLQLELELVKNTED